MEFSEILKAVFLGIVEGITEWLPISSTGHMILVDEFMKLDVSPEFMKMFLVVIQLGAIMAVVLLYFRKLWPFCLKHGDLDNCNTENNKKENTSVTGIGIKTNTFLMWMKILAACLPAAVIGLLFDDYIDELLLNPVVVMITLIVYGVLFIVLEKKGIGDHPKTPDIDSISFKQALGIGVFQLLALIPGTSRSGATILGGMILGTSRAVAAEFTFFLAVPVMAGASLLKLVKFGLETGFAMQTNELVILLTGMIVAFVVSVFVIRFLMSYIRKHNFVVFGWYRIVLGIILLGYFVL